MRKSKNSGLSNVATAPVSLKVLSWNVAGLAEDCTDIFLSQISMLADWDVLLLQECFRKLDGVNVGAHELFTPSELMGGLRCPAVIVNWKWKGQSKIVGGAARWTAVELDGQLTLISAHLPHKGRKLGEFEATLTELQEFLNGRPKQHVILGGDFNVNLFGMTDYLHVGESIPRPRTLIDTNDSLRARALHTMVTELDLTVTNTWMNADTERELFTRSSWVKPRRLVDTNGLHHDFEKIGNETCAGSGLRLVQDRSQSGVCSSFVKTENEVHDEECCKLAWWGARRILARCGCSNIVTDWKSWNKLAPLLVETAKAHRRVESKGMSVTEMELETLLLRKKKTGRYLERSELNRLCREIWRKRRALKREKHLDKIKESAEMGSSQENAEQAFQLEINCKGRESRICSTKYFRDIYSISEEQEELTQSERRHWVELWKNMRIDCAGGMLISPKKLENVLKKLKNGKGSPDQITADVLKALPPECLEKLARSLSLMC